MAYKDDSGPDESERSRGSLLGISTLLLSNSGKKVEFFIHQIKFSSTTSTW